MAESNKEADVVQRSQSAFHSLDCVEAAASLGAAIEQLCKLKGIGPATASGTSCALVVESQRVWALCNMMNGVEVKLTAPFTK